VTGSSFEDLLLSDSMETVFPTKLRATTWPHSYLPTREKIRVSTVKILPKREKFSISGNFV
jgi:hypothetical protein